MRPETKITDLNEFRHRKKPSRETGGGRTGGPGPGIMLGRGITDADMRKLENHFQNPQTEKEHRDRALYLILSRTALRAREIVSLRLSDAVTLPDGKTAFPVRRKGGRIVPAIPGDTALAALREYHATLDFSPEEFFLTLPNRARKGMRRPLDVRSLERIVERWGKELNIHTGRDRRNTQTGERTCKLHPHAFRHTALQRLFSLVGAEAARKVGGHTSTRTLERFYTATYFDASDHLDWRT
tara:strand:- start:2256 stop:2978 length:723 start_codon:yes stop_codon:yes gene_type:complete